MVEDTDKGVFVHAMKAYRGNRGTLPLIFISVLDGGQWAVHALTTLLLGKGPPVPIG